MSSNTAKPIRIAVLAHDGTLLGYVMRKPHNGSWRMLGKNPRVTLCKKHGARECMRGRMTTAEGIATGIASGWVAVLSENESPPADMEAP